MGGGCGGGPGPGPITSGPEASHGGTSCCSLFNVNVLRSWELKWGGSRFM